MFAVNIVEDIHGSFVHAEVVYLKGKTMRAIERFSDKAEAYLDAMARNATA